jgi:hypothetical protein
LKKVAFLCLSNPFLRVFSKSHDSLKGSDASFAAKKKEKPHFPDISILERREKRKQHVVRIRGRYTF